MNMLQRLQKTVSAKAISMLLVVSMLFGALPANTVLVANAAGETNLRLHLMVAEDQDFECPALNAWSSKGESHTSAEMMVQFFQVGEMMKLEKVDHGTVAFRL